MVLLNPDMKESHLHHLTLLPLDRLNMHKYSKKNVESFQKYLNLSLTKAQCPRGQKGLNLVMREKLLQKHLLCKKGRKAKLAKLLWMNMHSCTQQEMLILKGPKINNLNSVWLHYPFPAFFTTSNNFRISALAI